MKNEMTLPPLKWDDDRWIGSIVLGSWAGFRKVEGSYISEDVATDSDGSACLNISTSGDKQSSPTQEQIAAHQYIIENQEAIKNLVLQEIFAFYPEQRDLYGYDDEELEKYAPDIQNSEQLRSLIAFSDVHISSVHKDGLAYVGFEFVCTWDDEHQLGVMTHANRIVDVGGADVVNDWSAEFDAKKGS